MGVMRDKSPPPTPSRKISVDRAYRRRAGETERDQEEGLAYFQRRQRQVEPFATSIDGLRGGEELKCPGKDKRE